MIQTRKFGAYIFGSSALLNDRQLEQLAQHFKQQPQPAESALEGRSAYTIDQIDGIGSVVIKPYMRGGLLRYVVKRRYLKLGSPRCRHEFELLQNVRKLGIAAPEPVAFAYSGRLYYLGWLITRAIEQPKSLVHLANTDTGTAQKVMPLVSEQISKLIQHRIQHIDLHPGNVIVDRDGRVFIIDFDKGRVFSGSRDKLRDLYLQRWQRAVSKHGLPLWLNERLYAGLTGEDDKTIAMKRTGDD
jgi:3-deoxy-D-manno-octulosonic acid kinase